MTSGIISVILTFMAYYLPDWMIWEWPTLQNDWQEPLFSALLGLAVGIAVYVFGMIDFVRRDVK